MEQYEKENEAGIKKLHDEEHGIRIRAMKYKDWLDLGKELGIPGKECKRVAKARRETDSSTANKLAESLKEQEPEVCILIYYMNISLLVRNVTE
jgi:hypothetical protein